MVKFKDFSRPWSAFQVLFKANLIFKDFKTVLNIQVPFKPVRTLRVSNTITLRSSHVNFLHFMARLYSHVIFTAHTARALHVYIPVKPSLSQIEVKVSEFY